GWKPRTSGSGALQGPQYVALKKRRSELPSASRGGTLPRYAVSVTAGAGASTFGGPATVVHWSGYGFGASVTRSCRSPRSTRRGFGSPIFDSIVHSRICWV